MDMAAILVMWSGPFEQTFVPLCNRGSIRILTLTGLLVSEEMFKEFGGQTTDAYLYYKLTSESSALENKFGFRCRFLQINVQTVYIAIVMHVCM